MKNIRYSIIAYVFLLMACDYLDQVPDDWHQPDDVFTNEQTFRRPINMIYTYLPDGFNHVDRAYLDGATNDGISTIVDSDIHKIARGFITSSKPIIGCWDDSYKGIRQAIFARENLQKYPLFLNHKTPEEVQEEKDIYAAETKCLQAFFEFNLLRHYGGFPIVDEVYSINSPDLADKKRDSFKDCVKHIVSLCEQADTVLKVEPIGGVAGNYGRMTRGIALAIKAKTLLYAASPLYNREGNNNALLGYTDLSGLEGRWKAAAKACADVINLNNDGSISPAGDKVYKLQTSGAYNEIFTKLSFAGKANSEYILFKSAGKNNDLENRHYPPSISRDQGGGSVPSQQLIDAFTMADGSDYNHSLDGPTMFDARDPRLQEIFGYDGSSYGSRTIYTRVGENATVDALNQTKNRSTNTGYYLAKFLNKKLNFGASTTPTTFHLYPIIRLSDILLSYAEAMANAYGIDADPEGYGLTATEAVRQVRERAGFTGEDKFLDGVSGVEQFMNKVKQERRVELCFEEHRYYDLRRWLDGEQLAEPIKGMKIEESVSDLTYTRFIVDDGRNFKDHMYFHPIPLSVIRTNPSIVQNPTW